MERSGFTLIGVICLGLAFLSITSPPPTLAQGLGSSATQVTVRKDELPGSCDDSISHNLHNALPDLIKRTNKKMDKHLLFYGQMQSQNFLSHGLARKVSRAEEIIATNTPICQSPEGCDRRQQKALERANRLLEKAGVKSERFEAKLEKRVCKVDGKWHKIEARILKLANHCRVPTPPYELHPIIPVDIECVAHQ